MYTGSADMMDFRLPIEAVFHVVWWRDHHFPTEARPSTRSRLGHFSPLWCLLDSKLFCNKMLRYLGVFLVFCSGRSTFIGRLCFDFHGVFRLRHRWMKTYESNLRGAIMHFSAGMGRIVQYPTTLPFLDVCSFVFLFSRHVAHARPFLLHTRAYSFQIVDPAAGFYCILSLSLLQANCTCMVIGMLRAHMPY